MVGGVGLFGCEKGSEEIKKISLYPRKQTVIDISDENEKQYAAIGSGNEAYNIQAKVVDIAGKEHHLNSVLTWGTTVLDKFSFSQFSLEDIRRENIPYNIKNLTLTLGEKDSEIKRFFWLPKIRKIERDNYDWRPTSFYLADGREFSGRWIHNGEIEFVYQRDAEGIYYPYLYGKIESTPKKINIKHIWSIELDGSESNKVFNKYYMGYKKKHPKRIMLLDDSVIESDFSWLLDVYGEWGGSRFRTDLEERCTIQRKDKHPPFEYIPLEKIEEIEFLNIVKKRKDFSGKIFLAYRPTNGIILRYRDGHEEKRGLYLVDHSSEGKWVLGGIHTNDSIIAMQDYGRVIIPLRYVKKIIPIHAK